MSEDPTRNLFEEQVLNELAAIRQEVSQQSVRLISLEERMVSLENKVDARLRETRPIWEGVQQRLTETLGRVLTNVQDKILVPESADGQTLELRYLFNRELPKPNPEAPK